MEDEEEYEHSPSEFYYPDEEQISERDEETSAQPSSGSQEEIEGFINNQKSFNTTKKTSTDVNTLFRYMKSIGMRNESTESLPASDLDYLLSKFFMNIRKKNGEELRIRYHIRFSAKHSKVFE